MTSAKATSAERTQIKDACLYILSTFEGALMSTKEITSLIRSDFPHLVPIINRGGSGQHLVGAILFQIASTKKGKYQHIQNPSRGHYIYTEHALPRRTDVSTYAPHRGHAPQPRPKALPEALPQEPVTITKSLAEPTTVLPSAIDGAPHFTFVGKIGGKYIVRNDKGTLYVLQPAELA